MQVKYLFSMLLCLLMLVACTKHDGSQYVGKWKDKSGGVMEFVKEGDAIFMVAKGNKIPLIRNTDNTLKFGDAVFSYSEKSDSIFATMPADPFFGGGTRNQELVRAK